MRVFTTVTGQKTMAATEREVAPSTKVRNSDPTALPSASRGHLLASASCAVLRHRK